MKSSQDETITKVGIGASAGGLDAIQRLISKLDKKNGFAYFIVMHLSPTKESNLTEILSRSTSMPVILAEENLEIKKDHIYVIPPNKNMSTSDNKLIINDFRGEERTHLTINYLFQSIAKESEDKSIGVVLSGTGSDGSLGLKAIKEKGGITFAQSQESAQYYQMPHQAAITANVDFILSPEEIAFQINNLGDNFSSFVNEKNEEKVTGTNQILRLLRKQYKIDFSNYKPSTVNRRINRRMIMGGYQNTVSYAERLSSDPQELKRLYNDLLINVTQFFRDPGAFDELKNNVFPALIGSNSRSRDEIRVWVVGCSTGEEVYSIAIILFDYLDEIQINRAIKIYGTDVNADAISTARSGYYSESIVQNLSESQLLKYFTKKLGGYQISKRIRESCIFAEHNVISDPPFANMDLIVCRNLMIYLDTAYQERLIATFHYALKPSGYLFLGKSETIGTQKDLFKTENHEYKIYSKKYVPNAN